MMIDVEEMWPEELSPDRLRDFAAEVAKVREALVRATRSARAPITSDYVRAMLRARRVRDRFFPPDLFADPAWDMLLDLFAARLEGKRVAISSLCVAAAVPPTTALRWINSLEVRGYIRRVPDDTDARRRLVELTEEAAEKVEATLITAQAASPLLM